MQGAKGAWQAMQVSPTVQVLCASWALVPQLCFNCPSYCRFFLNSDFRRSPNFGEFGKVFRISIKRPYHGLTVSIDLLVQQPFLQFSASGIDCELERNVVGSSFNLIFILQGGHPCGHMCWSWSALPCWPLAKARRRQTHCVFQFSPLCFNSQFTRSFSTDLFSALCIRIIQKMLHFLATWGPSFGICSSAFHLALPCPHGCLPRERHCWSFHTQTNFSKSAISAMMN